jgi:hypothetical protein
MARDTGSYTLSTPPVVDPAKVLTVSAASANNTTTLSYTTSAAHNLTLGAPVIIYGTGNVGLNFNPDGNLYGGVTSTTAIGWGTPATVASVTGTNTFTVKAPAVVATASVSVGTVINDSLVSESPYGSSSKQQSWLPTSAQTNVVVAHEWNNSFPIQPNDDRAANVAVTAVSGNGTQVTLTVGSGHGLVAGQSISIQGIIPTSYNVDAVIAATGATSVIFNSPLKTKVTSVTNAAIVKNVPAAGAPAVVTSATGATSTTQVIAYTTATPHGLTAGQNVAVKDASNVNYNASGVITTTTSTTFTIGAPKVIISGVTGTAGTGTVGDGTNVRYVGTSVHGLAAGDKVSVYGFTPSGYNVTDATVLSAGLTATAFAVANTTTTAVTAKGYGIKQSGSFSGTASVSLGDESWSTTYLIPSGNLDPSVDNHDRVTNSDSGYPAFTPSYTAPNVIGLTTSYAIQKIRAAGMTPGFVQFSSDITATTVATTSTTLQVTSGTAHNLSVGDTVNLSGSSNTTLNVGDAVVSSVPSTVSFIVTASGCTGTVGATALKFRPKNTVVSAQSPSAGATTATVVGFTRNYGI